MEQKRYLIHTDGGSRGNPGPAAIGVVIESDDGILKKEYGEYIGETTNNEAEYQAVIFALNKLKQLVGEEAKTSDVAVHSDSELLVRQFSGLYKVKQPRIKELFLELWNLRLDFSSVKITHIMRGKNKDADRMVNLALDKHLKIST